MWHAMPPLDSKRRILSGSSLADSVKSRMGGLCVLFIIKLMITDWLGWIIVCGIVGQLFRDFSGKQVALPMVKVNYLEESLYRRRLGEEINLKCQMVWKIVFNKSGKNIKFLKFMWFDIFSLMSKHIQWVTEWLSVIKLSSHKNFTSNYFRRKEYRLCLNKT